MTCVRVECGSADSTVVALNGTVRNHLARHVQQGRTHLCVYLTHECPLSRTPQLVGRALGFASRARGAGATVDVYVGDADPSKHAPPQCAMRQRHDELPLGHIALLLEGRFNPEERASLFAALHGFPCDTEGRRFCFVPDGPMTRQLPLLCVRRTVSRADDAERVAPEDTPTRHILWLDIGGETIEVGPDYLCIPHDDQYLLRPLWHNDNPEISEQWLNKLLAFLQHE